MFLDRKSLILNTDEVRQYPEAKSLMDREASPDPDRVLSRRVQEIELGPSSHKNTQKVGGVWCVWCVCVWCVCACALSTACVEEMLFCFCA